MTKKCCKLTFKFRALNKEVGIDRDLQIAQFCVNLVGLSTTDDLMKVFAMTTAKGIFDCNLRGKSSFKWRDIKRVGLKK